MPWVLTVALVVIAAVVTGAYLFDRRARARGHRPRAGWSSNRALRETQRDLKTGTTGSIFHQDMDWMSTTQRDKDPEAQRRREES